MRAAAPPNPGLAEAGFLPNDTAFNLTEQPARLALLGGGPIGCELAQAFARLGSEVTIIEMGEHFLLHEDADAVEILRAAFERDGVDVRLGTVLDRVEIRDDVKVLHLTSSGAPATLEADAILVGVGRATNVDGLGLEAAGVRFGPRGVEVDDHLRTANPRVYAAGDTEGFVKAHVRKGSDEIVGRRGGEKGLQLHWPR